MPILKKRLFAAISPVALLLAPPASAQTAVPPARSATPVPLPAPVPVAVPVAVDADPALWVVKDRDTTIYLFGTVHVLKPGLRWFDEGVKKAFDASQQVVLEYPLASDEESKAVLLSLAIDPDGPPLTEKLHANKRAAYAAALAKLGRPPAALDRVYPWFAAITLTQLMLQQAGYSLTSGAERTIDAAAKAAGKPVTGLETLQQQLGFFASLSEADQIAFLESGVDDLDKGEQQIGEMVADWAKGDPDALATVMNSDIDKLPNLYKVLLVDRNKRWAWWINERMKQPGTVFIAVGAGHLAGKDSVQRQLAAYKRKAKRVKY